MATSSAASKPRICSRCKRKRAPHLFATPAARVCTPCKRSNNRRAGRALRLRQTYGITLAEYEALYEAQGGACAGCGGVRRYNLHVDHCHETERQALADGLDAQAAARKAVRGLLCARCNKVLRDVRDVDRILEALAVYLRNPPAWGVIK